jgi:hypothetical protein
MRFDLVGARTYIVLRSLPYFTTYTPKAVTGPLPDPRLVSKATAHPAEAGLCGVGSERGREGDVDRCCSAGEASAMCSTDCW